MVLRIEPELGNARQAQKSQAGTEGAYFHLLAIKEILKEDFKKAKKCKKEKERGRYISLVAPKM